MTSADAIDRLEHDGYVVVEQALDPLTVAEARAELEPLLAATEFGTNSFLGRRTRRVFALFAKCRALDGAALHPLVRSIADHYLGHHHLSSTVAIEIHPGEAAQTLHSDDGAWPVPRSWGETVVNSIWALDDFTEENGATRLVPGSHRWPDGRTPGDEVTVPATMPAGSVLVYLGSLWHAGGENRSRAPRLGVVLEYTVSWLRQQENLPLTCTPEVAATLPDDLAELVGYNLRPPFVGHVDGGHPLDLVRRVRQA
jgi:ectoine hydroxylase-related dioxygenase (phytanoyl-CoA dioxygenase family)